MKKEKAVEAEKLIEEAESAESRDLSSPVSVAMGDLTNPHPTPLAPPEAEPRVLRRRRIIPDSPATAKPAGTPQQQSAGEEPMGSGAKRNASPPAPKSILVSGQSSTSSKSAAKRVRFATPLKEKSPKGTQKPFERCLLADLDYFEKKTMAQQLFERVVGPGKVETPPIGAEVEVVAEEIISEESSRPKRKRNSNRKSPRAKKQKKSDADQIGNSSQLGQSGAVNTQLEKSSETKVATKETTNEPIVDVADGKDPDTVDNTQLENSAETKVAEESASDADVNSQAGVEAGRFDFSFDGFSAEEVDQTEVAMEEIQVESQENSAPAVLEWPKLPVKFISTFYIQLKPVSPPAAPTLVVELPRSSGGMRVKVEKNSQLADTAEKETQAGVEVADKSVGANISEGKKLVADAEGNGKSSETVEAAEDKSSGAEGNEELMDMGREEESGGDEMEEVVVVDEETQQNPNDSDDDDLLLAAADCVLATQANPNGIGTEEKKISSTGSIDLEEEFRGISASQFGSQPSSAGSSPPPMLPAAIESPPEESQPSEMGSQQDEDELLAQMELDEIPDSQPPAARATQPTSTPVEIPRPANTPNETVTLADNDPQVAHLTCSNLTEAEKHLVRKFVGRVKRGACRFSEDLDDLTTHLVVKAKLTADGYRVDLRTIKYVQAVAKRLIVVSFDWIVESLEQKLPLPTDGFEVVGDTDYPTVFGGAKLARSSDVQLFVGFRFFLFENLGEFSRDLLAELVEAEGGVVVAHLNDFPADKRKCFAVGWAGEMAERRAQWNGLCEKGIGVVSQDFILDSITCRGYAPLPTVALCDSPLRGQVESRFRQQLTQEN